jgi:hypothetical protein
VVAIVMLIFASLMLPPSWERLRDTRRPEDESRVCRYSSILLHVAEEPPKPYSIGQRSNHYTSSNEVD